MPGSPPGPIRNDGVGDFPPWPQVTVQPAIAQGQIFMCDFHSTDILDQHKPPLSEKPPHFALIDPEDNRLAKSARTPFRQAAFVDEVNDRPEGIIEYDRAAQLRSCRQ